MGGDHSSSMDKLCLRTSNIQVELPESEQLTKMQAFMGSALPFSKRGNDSNPVAAEMISIVPDESFNFGILNTLGMATYQGSDIGEVLVAASGIKTGDFESFYQAFYELAERVREEGAHIDSRKHAVSARNNLFRQATYYRNADFYLHGNWSDPRIYSLWKQQSAAFDKATSLLPIPGERVKIRASKFTVPAIFYKTGRPGRRPTVILGNGYDGSMEDLYHTMVEALLQRGINALVYEGPGQPSVRRYQNLGFIPEWETVVTPVVDYALSRREVDPKAIALMGFSFGGLLAPRAAAFEHRLAAVISLDGLYSFGESILAQAPPEWAQLLKEGKKAELDHLVAQIQDNPNVTSNIRWALDQGEWSFNTHSAYEFVKRAQAFTLEGVVDKIKAPVFVGDGQSDMFFAGQAKKLADSLGDQATYHLFTDEQGAGQHCQVGAFVLMNQVALDWLEDVLARIGSYPTIYGGKPSSSGSRALGI